MRRANRGSACGAQVRRRSGCTCTKLQENFTCFHDKLHEHEVYNCFVLIINNAKKFSKPEARVSIGVGSLNMRKD